MQQISRVLITISYTFNEKHVSCKEIINSCVLLFFFTVPLNSSCTQRNCSDLCVRIHESGQDKEQCLCPLGSKLTDDTCLACSNLTYGENCQWNCSCAKEHTSSCDAISGQCFCLPGWTSDDCSIDIDECSSGMVYCGLRYDCINTPGSYRCQCNDDSELDGFGNCVYKGCVKNLTQTSGVIKSPNYPSKYDSSSNCRWTITVPVNYVIKLNFTSLQLECNYDYVTVYDGLYTSSPQLGRYCALPNGTLLQSSANTLLITFTSDTSVEYTGFRVTYNATGCPPFRYLSDCSGVCNCSQENALGCNMRTGQCQCRSGYGLTNCSDIDECRDASICPQFSRCINLNGSYRCDCYEGLQMSYTGVCIVNSSSQCTNRNCSNICAKVTENNAITEKCYCPKGRKLNGNICEECSNFTFGENCQSSCSCNNGTAWYCDPVSGQCQCRSGWGSANCSVDVDECSFGGNTCGSNGTCINTPGSYRCQCVEGYELNAMGTFCTYNCVKNFTQNSGVIKSPNYPSNYDPYNNCRWLITVAEDSIVTLNFSVLKTECYYDYVTVYDGSNASSPLLGRFCEKPLNSLRSTNNTMLVTFTSDAIIQFAGFMATFNATGCPPFKYLPPQCNGTCNCVQGNSRHCNMLTGQCVCKTGWTGPDCSVDVNECLDLPCTNYSQCVNRRGSYECNCLNGLTKSADSGLCKVDTNSVCSKKVCSHVCVKVTENKIKVEKCYCPLGTKLAVNTCKVCDNFTYGSECQNKCSCTSKNAASCDPVRGRCTCLAGWRSQNCSVDIDECSTGNVTCGKNSQCTNTPGSYKCVCNDNFGMDALGYCVFKGYNYMLANSSGVIMSPGYPYFYPSLLSSRWNITVTRGFKIRLRVTAVNTECGFDDVKVYDGDNELSKPLGRFCRLPNATLVSSNNKLLIVFTSDLDISGSGFMATYNITR
ncbi:Dorsal-ventral patterning tolloid-like protein 1 [Bulinus truncatus]|nr:Dorsal-ventral patterning tolloid-like protein 1 [Bulinus truncatus]